MRQFVQDALEKAGTAFALYCACAMGAIGFAEEAIPVTFPDPALDALIRETIDKPTGPIFNTDLVGTGFTNLDGEYRNIKNLSGLEFCTDLSTLMLSSNQIETITQLKYLSNLKYVYLSSNYIEDLTPLMDLTNISYLVLNNNKIVNIDTLIRLANLRNLYLSNNVIVNINVIQYFHNLDSLSLDNNYIENIYPIGLLFKMPAISLSNNRIQDISPLNSEKFTFLDLSSNMIRDFNANIEASVLFINDNRIRELPTLCCIPRDDYECEYGRSFFDLRGNPFSERTCNNGFPYHTTFCSSYDVDGCDEDTDGDGLTDFYELKIGTGSLVKDSDRDGFNDAQEVAAYTNPMDATDFPVSEIPVIFPDMYLDEAARTAIYGYFEEYDTVTVKAIANAVVTSLSAPGKDIDNITGLEYLTDLSFLDLSNNAISDLRPLVDNPGMDAGDTVLVSGNPLSNETLCIDIPVLLARGVAVTYDGVCADAAVHTADLDGDHRIGLDELLRVIQFFQMQGLYCADDPGDTEDGYVSGPGANVSCARHDSDYEDPAWSISLHELLRLVQIYNLGGYTACPAQGTADGFCVRDGAR